MLTSGCKSNTKEIYYPPAPYSPTPPPSRPRECPCHKEGYISQDITPAPRGAYLGAEAIYKYGVGEVCISLSS